MGHQIFNTFTSSAIKIIGEEIYCQNIVANTPFQQQIQVFALSSIHRHRLFKIAEILTIVPYAAKFSFTDNSTFTYTLANVFIFRPRILYKL